MKRMFVIACSAIAIIMCFALSGCGQEDGQYADSEYLGKWTATQVELNGSVNPVDKYLESEFSITLNADGSATVVNKGASNVGVWEPTNEGFELDKGASKFVSNGEAVTLKYDGLKFIFEKQ